MKKITIPADIDAAVADLNGLGALITAKEWHRAAIVAAFVTLAEGKGKTPANAGSSISCEAFAALGITGLKSKDTVRRYVKIWESTGQPTPKPGHEVAIPNMPWVEWKDTLIEEGEITSKKSTDYVTAPRVEEAIKSNPRIAEAAIEAAVKADPKAVATAVAKSTEATAEYAEVRREEQEERVKAARVSVSKATPTAATKSMDAKVAARNAVSDWLILVHEASAKLRAAESLWSKVEADLIEEDLREANASLIDLEGDAVVLRQRVADKNTSLSGTSV